MSGIGSHGGILLSDAEWKSKTGKGSAGVFFQGVLFQSVSGPVSCQFAVGKTKPFISGFVMNAQILCINSSQQERGNEEGGGSAPRLHAAPSGLLGQGGRKRAAKTLYIFVSSLW